MSDHGTHHHDADHSSEIKSKTAFKSSFWFVIILVGLFIAALNFIHVMGDSSQGHEPKEATSNSTLKGETGLGREKDDTAASQHAEAGPADLHREGANLDTTAHGAQH